MNFQIISVSTLGNIGSCAPRSRRPLGSKSTMRRPRGKEGCMVRSGAATGASQAPPSSRPRGKEGCMVRSGAATGASQAPPSSRPTTGARQRASIYARSNARFLAAGHPSVHRPSGRPSQRLLGERRPRRALPPAVAARRRRRATAARAAVGPRDPPSCRLGGGSSTAGGCDRRRDRQDRRRRSARCDLVSPKTPDLFEAPSAQHPLSSNFEPESHRTSLTSTCAHAR
jgi:hypothetical protein